MAEEMEIEAEPEVVEVAELTVVDALKEVLKKALIHNGLKRGLHECVKALDRGQGRLCCLAKDCDNEEYSRLVQALVDESNARAAQQGVPPCHLVMVDSGTELGEWCGLVKLDAEGELRKAVRCSCAVVTEFGEETPALGVVLNYVRSEEA
mmetsp:Transcript_1830/g.6321  ORF Transcript_1830/g.6321 Transcript_1830/m.6321 type:complete len:151 (-) Transcript_1830:58-510(-)|eukprot:CAMPEP_0198424552 /NCGR_PEP_ID=MMETSP1452-20131203/3944_1 /TAXON_ID=1181717 /ORGANISM="Synchroma pusillum, Strain CCMP3072" /LENGTH=150 /DNA_ID=CAMNT_0044144897 /DNA_START=44 /DNA_END=496 /DNA_ORIENTATION=+